MAVSVCLLGRRRWSSGGAAGGKRGRYRASWQASAASTAPLAPAERERRGVGRENDVVVAIGEEPYFSHLSRLGLAGIAPFPTNQDGRPGGAPLSRGCSRESVTRLPACPTTNTTLSASLQVRCRDRSIPHGHHPSPAMPAQRANPHADQQRPPTCAHTGTGHCRTSFDHLKGKGLGVGKRSQAFSSSRVLPVAPTAS